MGAYLGGWESKKKKKLLTVPTQGLNCKEKETSTPTSHTPPAATHCAQVVAHRAGAAQADVVGKVGQLAVLVGSRLPVRRTFNPGGDTPAFNLEGGSLRTESEVTLSLNTIQYMYNDWRVVGGDQVEKLLDLQSIARAMVRTFLLPEKSLL